MERTTLDLTEKDKELLKRINAARIQLNGAIHDGFEKGYEIAVEVQETKQGYNELLIEVRKRLR